MISHDQDFPTPPAIAISAQEIAAVALQYPRPSRNPPDSGSVPAALEAAMTENSSNCQATRTTRAREKTKTREEEARNDKGHTPPRVEPRDTRQPSFPCSCAHPFNLGRVPSRGLLANRAPTTIIKIHARQAK
jgi:hypothetical protein